MIKTLLIVSILLTSSVNANMFQALKDAAAKAVEDQKNSNEDNMAASADQPSTRQFNSLAEEEAFKKRQGEEKISNSKEYEQELKNTIIPRIQRLRASEANFYLKYLVKQNDKQEMIDDKFKNRTQLYSAMQKDFAVLDAERENLYNILYNNKDSDLGDVQNKVLKDQFKETTWYGELSSIFSNASASYPDGYILSCSYYVPLQSSSDEIYVEDLRTRRESFQNANAYEKYLKCTYLTYQKRLDEKANKVKELQAQKEQQNKLANEQKERQKVQSACQAWRTKANKGVYSLGIGDKIMSKNGGLYIIQGVNTNTFLVNWRGNSMYLQKSDLIPYESLKTAPSEYCYQ
jgi:hypothetical protein